MASPLLALLRFLMVLGTQAAVLEFGLMVNYMTGRLPLTSYGFYGCYCGLGGSGWPVDEVDWCCHTHDCCYDVLIKTGCTPIRQPYKFSRVNGTIICGDEDLDGCARKSCECDRTASYCFQEFNSQYSRWNGFNFNRNNCSGTQPPCSH